MAIKPVMGKDDVMKEEQPLATYEAVLKADGVRHEEIFNAPFAVDVGVDSFTLSCDRDQFPDTGDLVIKCRAEASYDGGETWELLAAFTACGGESTAPDGTLQTTSWLNVPFKEPNNPNRMVRTTMVPIKTVTTKMECVCHKGAK